MSKVITRLIAKDGGDSDIRPEEIGAMAKLGEQQGVFHDREAFILRNILQLRDLRTKDVMTPRIVVFMLDENQTIGEVMNEFEEIEFSRIQIYANTPDQITGYILKDEILLNAARDNHDVKLASLKRDFHRVADGESLLQTLESLSEAPGSIAYGVDEFGGFAGVITLEDVVETLLGLEIVDESDTVADLRELAREQMGSPD